MLQIAKDAALTDIVSTGGSQTNPITTKTSISGGTVQQQLWLFNDDVTKKYETISVQPTDTTTPADANWVQLAPDNSGSPGTYLSGSATLSMGNVSGNTESFWMKVTTPQVAQVENVTSVKLTVNYDEYAV